jgi:peptide/nickel transport system ATP-binding protein
MTQPLVQVRDLTVSFVNRDKTVAAVNGVSFDLEPGAVLGVLGESGSGKSVMLRSLLRLHPPKRTKIGGSIKVAGQSVLELGPGAIEDYRGKVCSMVFQEPMLAFDPVFTVGQQIAESVRRHEGVDESAARARALEMFERVRIPSPQRRLDAYPHEFSGGMRQRAMIALALACKPKLLLADEPTTALDATVQIQILLLLRELQRDLGLAIIFVTHDIGVAAEIADRVAVMYAGRIVESGPVRDIINRPLHPYTKGLLASRVERARKGDRLATIAGSPPDLSALPPGCAFAPRCPFALPTCMAAVPALTTVAPGQMAACIRISEIAPKPAAHDTHRIPQPTSD